MGRCLEHEVTADLAEMMRLRAGTRLNAWIRAVREGELQELHSFAAGIEQDYDAVLAALTLPYSSGVVEGHVNRVVMWNLICQARTAQCAKYQGANFGCSLAHRACGVEKRRPRATMWRMTGIGMRGL